MSRKRASSISATLLTLVISAAHGTQPGDTVEDFELVDHTGKAQALYQPRSTQPIVIMIQGNGCPIVRHSVPALQQISEKYARNVRFLLLNSNVQDNRATIAREVEEFIYPFPVLLDQQQAIGEKLQVQRTSEVFVIDPRTRKLVYRGSIDDRLSYESQRPATRHYLTDALDAMLTGQKVKVPYVDGVGCLVNFPNRRRT